MASIWLCRGSSPGELLLGVESRSTQMMLVQSLCMIPLSKPTKRREHLAPHFLVLSLSQTQQQCTHTHKGKQRQHRGGNPREARVLGRCSTSCSLLLWELFIPSLPISPPSSLFIFPSIPFLRVLLSASNSQLCFTSIALGRKVYTNMPRSWSTLFKSLHTGGLGRWLSR